MSMLSNVQLRKFSKPMGPTINVINLKKKSYKMSKQIKILNILRNLEVAVVKKPRS